MSQMLARRPGVVTFAAVMMFVLAGFTIVYALAELFNAVWVSTGTYGVFGGYLWLWGIIDVVLAAIAFYAGYDILRGGPVGQVLGLIIASVSAIRWFFYIPAAPWVAVTIIAVDIIIIYGLAAHSEYFTGKGTGAA